MSTYAFISTHSSIVASMETVISMKAFSIGFTRAKNITRTPRKAANCPSFLLHGKHTFSTRNTIACSVHGGGGEGGENLRMRLAAYHTSKTCYTLMHLIFILKWLDSPICCTTLTRRVGSKAIHYLYEFDL